MRRLVACAALSAALLAAARSAHAGPSHGAGAAGASLAPPITITMVSDTSLVLDSNSPCTAGPRTMYVQFRLTNTSGASIGPLTATISGFAGGIALTGGQPASQMVGSLAAGAPVTVSWFVEYPCTFGVRTTLTVSVTDASAGATTGSGTVSTRSMISAQAGGNLLSQTIGAGAVVGAVVPMDVQYTFGGAVAGDAYNLQPAGTVTFDARCFRLVGSEVVASDVTAVPVGARDQLLFTASAKQTGTDKRATMRYYFRLLCAGATTTASPYASQQSGSTNLKYSGNFDNFAPTPFPAVGNSFTVAKSVAPATLSDGGPVTYTVTVSNTATVSAFIDSIADVLPAGVTYGGLSPSSGVTAANSSAVPAGGSTGRIVWRGRDGVTYSVPAGGSIQVVYTATVPSVEGTYTNTASAYSGFSQVGTASAALVVRRQADVSVTIVGPDSAYSGDTVRYVVTTRNNGPSAARSVVVTDTLPAGLAFVAATRGGTVTGGVLGWPAVDSLAAGAVVTDTVLATVSASSGTLTSIAAAATVTQDPVPANNNGSAAASRASTYVIPSTYAVQVTPQGLATPALRLAGGGYSQTFTVTNGSNVAASFDLLARVTGAAPTWVVLDSLTGSGLPAGARDSARVALGVGAAVTYTLWYTVSQGAAAEDTLRLAARSVSVPAVSAEGWAQVRRVRADVALTKSASPAGQSRPGTDITYTLQFSNPGESAARNVIVTDLLPAELAFRLGSVQETLPAGVTATIDYSSDNGATWSYAPSSGGCAASSGYDACVRRIRWTLQGDLAAGGASSGTLRFIARIR